MSVEYVPLPLLPARLTDVGQSCDVSTYLPVTHRLRRLCTDCYSLDTVDEEGQSTGTTAPTAAPTITTSPTTNLTATTRTGKERFCACEAGVERVCPECPWVWQETAAAGDGEGGRAQEREGEGGDQGQGECWVCDRQVGPRERGGGWFCLWCERPCGDVGREPAAVVRVVGDGE